MVELNSQIDRLEMLCEQLITYLRTTERSSTDANVRRADLFAMLKEMERLKRKRCRLETALGLPQTA
jgi:hypothetical protein